MNTKLFIPTFPICFSLSIFSLNKRLLLLFILLNFIYLVNFSQIKMNSSGYTSIGNVPAPASPYSLTVYHVKFYNGIYSPLIIDQTGTNYGLALYPQNTNTSSIGNSSHCFSDIYYMNLRYGSDKRIKENIRSIKNPLNIIMNLNGIEFDYTKKYVNPDSIKYNSKTIEKIEKDRKNRLGFIAQDVQRILPEAVFYDDSVDIYSMDYTRIIPVLVEAMKEQQNQIDSLKKVISKPKSTLKSATITTDLNKSVVIEASLDQNIPNPFNQTSEIGYFLPETLSKVVLYIYNMNGNQIKSYQINTRGKGSIIINASELQPGMYLYTLIADEKEIDTKRMILTE